MVRPRLSDFFESEPIVADGDGNPIADYRETIVLLQEEVARLEQELQVRDQRGWETASSAEASVQDEVEPAAALENIAGAPQEVDRLKAELAGYEETIRLLLDELSRVEEVQAASRAEWEHLAGWVAELEHRVEGQDGDALHQLENRLAAQQQTADALRMRFEQDRRAWEAQRQIDQEEIARLPVTRDQVANSSEASAGPDARSTQGSGPDADVAAALRAENLRLRAAWQELVERNAPADRSESWDAELAETLKEREQLRRQLEQVQDERKRERLEHEATVAELHARLSQASLTPPQGPPPEKSPEGISPALDVELRFRALRQHLLEIDQREKEERRQKHLITRMSRLWSRTGPR
jgi:hypothetical protein